MSDTALSLILRPLVVFGFFLLVAIIGYWIRRAIPEGRVKRFLTQPANMYPKSEAERRSWVPFIAWLTAAVLVWVIPMLIWVWVDHSWHHH